MTFLSKTLIIFCVTAGIMLTEGDASQEVKISGKVMDHSGTPIAGATVKVKNSGKTTVTDKDGNFSIPPKTGTIPSLGREAAQPDFAFLSRGKIEIHTSKRTVASIIGYNLHGKVIFKKERLVDAGVNLFSTPSLMHGVTLFKVIADGRTALLKTYTLGGMVLGGAQGESSPVFSRVSAKQAAAAQQLYKDTVFVTKEGYLEYATRINKKEISDLNMRLAKEDLPKKTEKFLFELGSAPFCACHAPGIVELPDGTLLAVYFGGKAERAPDQKVYLSRKEPGKEWTAPKAIPNTGGGGNPSLFRSFSGKLMRFDGWRGSVQTSTDDGKTWSALRKLPSKQGAEKNAPVQLEDGSILATSEAAVITSTDDGETWSKLSRGADQGTILIYPNNRLQLLSRTGGSGSIGCLWSNNNGKSWTGGKCILPNNNCGLDGTTLRNGTQVLAYNHSHRKQAGMGHKGRGFLTLSMSEDGEKWDAALIINYTTKEDFFQYSYPAVIQTRDGLIHIVHTWGRLTINHVIVNPKAIERVPMPDGKWPATGPNSLEEYKKAKPDYATPDTKGLKYDIHGKGCNKG